MKTENKDMNNLKFFIILISILCGYVDIKLLAVFIAMLGIVFLTDFIYGYIISLKGRKKIVFYITSISCSIEIIPFLVFSILYYYLMLKVFNINVLKDRIIHVPYYFINSATVMILINIYKSINPLKTFKRYIIRKILNSN